MVERLKPCPFCASEKTTLGYSGQPGTVFFIVCEECRASGPITHDNTWVEAVAAWDRRASEAEIDRLTKALALAILATT